MQPNLVVVRAFGPYAIGDVIVAPNLVAQILASDHAAHVVKVTPRQTEA
jgi:hypothetical protein